MTRWKMSLVSVMMATGIGATACEQTRELDAEAMSRELLAASGGGEEQTPLPPDEAFKACEGLAESANCTVQLESRSIEGTCRKGPEGQGELACAPNLPPPGGPGRPHGPPPKEAFAACETLAEGVNCTVQLESRSIEGTCRKGPEGQGELACAPNLPPPGGPGRPHGPPPKAIKACEGLAESANCTVQIESRSIEGTCRKGPEGQGELACAPNHPPFGPSPR